jgi:uncharacterized membrane protein YgdD (TMEM256/DUF423 family)
LILLRILIRLYLAFGIFAVAVVIIDPSDDPLSAVFLVMAAVPWTFALSALVDRVGEPPVWFNLVFLATGILINAGLLYALGLGLRRLLERRS